MNEAYAVLSDPENAAHMIVLGMPAWRAGGAPDFSVDFDLRISSATCSALVGFGRSLAQPQCRYAWEPICNTAST
jgi:hypothetical protein